jgi:hypothetical protein
MFKTLPTLFSPFSIFESYASVKSYTAALEKAAANIST